MAPPLTATIMNYGVGNLHSIRKAFERAGARAEVRTDVPERPDLLVLPGVGAFGAAASGLAKERERILRLLDEGTPTLGVCLGMQVLLDASEESPGRGLGFIPGRVERLKHPKLPQIGWNEIDWREDDPLFDGIERGAHVYYVNSFAPRPDDARTVVAESTYGAPFAAVLRKGHTYGVQFHPEKSSATGLALVKNFVGLAEGWT